MPRMVGRKENRKKTKKMKRKTKQKQLQNLTLVMTILQPRGNFASDPELGLIILVVYLTCKIGTRNNN